MSLVHVIWSVKEASRQFTLNEIYRVLTSLLSFLVQLNLEPFYSMQFPQKSAKPQARNLHRIANDAHERSMQHKNLLPVSFTKPFSSFLHWSERFWLASEPKRNKKWREGYISFRHRTKAATTKCSSRMRPNILGFFSLFQKTSFTFLLLVFLVLKNDILTFFLVTMAIMCGTIGPREEMESIVYWKAFLLLLQ